MELESERTKLSLATKISLRPNKETLEQKNILRGKRYRDCILIDPPSIESIPEEGAPVDSFEVRQTQLKSCLKKRAPKTELENQNILKGSINLTDANILYRARWCNRCCPRTIKEIHVGRYPAKQDFKSS